MYLSKNTGKKRKKRILLGKLSLMIDVAKFAFLYFIQAFCTIFFPNNPKQFRPSKFFVF